MTPPQFTYALGQRVWYSHAPPSVVEPFVIVQREYFDDAQGTIVSYGIRPGANPLAMPTWALETELWAATAEEIPDA